MPQIIYTNNLIGDNGKPINTTPAGKYAITDLAVILDCIARGEIICGTGQPYPVEWKEEDTLPWSDDQRQVPPHNY